MSTIESIRAAYSYDPETGVIFRTYARGQYASGTAVGSKGSGGYTYIRWRNSNIGAHRMAFALMTGAWPSEVVDHINGDRSDNRWSNLRQCTQSDNAKHRTVNPKAKSGVRGVRYNIKSSKTRPWEVLIKHNYKDIYIGRFRTKEEAIEARKAASAKYHGNFAGRIVSSIVEAAR